MRRLLRPYYFWVYIFHVPWTFDRLASGATSAVLCTFGLGMGIPALRDLGVIDSLLWQYLIFLPWAAAMIALRKMSERYEEDLAAVSGQTAMQYFIRVRLYGDD